MKPAALFNGGPPPPELAFSRGLHYGDGVFRTCLIYKYQVFDIQRQLQKLHEDSNKLNLVVRPPEQLREEAEQLARAWDAGVLKIMLLRAGAGRGYRSEDTAADRLLCSYQAPRYPAEYWEQGIRVFRCDLRLASQPQLAGIKHLNRLEQVLASRQWEEGAAEGILCDQAGRPVSGTRSNLFWVQGGTLYTPDLGRCGVAGVMRSKILEQARLLGWNCQVTAGEWTDLEHADEVFVTNSLIGLWPVRGMGTRNWPAPGPCTTLLAERLQHPRLS